MFFREQSHTDYPTPGESLRDDIDALMKGDDPEADAAGGKDKPPPRDRIAVSAPTPEGPEEDEASS